MLVTGWNMLRNFLEVIVPDPEVISRDTVTRLHGGVYGVVPPGSPGVSIGETNRAPGSGRGVAVGVAVAAAGGAAALAGAAPVGALPVGALPVGAPPAG